MRKIVAGLTVSIAVLSSSVALAATQSTAEMDVKLTLTSGCEIAVLQAADFGSNTAAELATAKYANGQVQINCSGPQTPKLKYDTANKNSAPNNFMGVLVNAASPTSKISYNIYQPTDAAITAAGTAWQAGKAIDITLTDGEAKKFIGLATNSATAAKEGGDYSDTMTFTLEF